MAGGVKETPRQKMVGMMYLVLTALLALQVSNAVLEKFSLIDESLRLSAKGAREDNLKMLRGTEDAVKNRGNRPADWLSCKGLGRRSKKLIWCSKNWKVCATNSPKSPAERMKSVI